MVATHNYVFAVIENDIGDTDSDEHGARILKLTRDGLCGVHINFGVNLYKFLGLK